MTRPFVLVICDGWGYNPDSFGNAIAAAHTPTIDALHGEWPHTVVAASGEAVGLPKGQQGNSEVGHLTIGAGRVILQDLPRITQAINDGSFFDNPALCKAVDRAREKNATLHCLGLISPGGVHSHQSHAVALAELAKRRGLRDVCFHVFADGRDEPPRSGADDVQKFIDNLARIGVGRIASVSGRYYAMDRDKRWDRTERAYNAMVGQQDEMRRDAVGYIKESYQRGITDEFIVPMAIGSGDQRVPMNDDDSIIFFNFRPDRARQLCHALVDADFAGFSRREVLGNIALTTFTPYDADLRATVAFPKPDIRDTLGEVISNAGLTQFHVAETEKYAHVTYFINGGREKPFPGEERLLIPSPKVATYDAVPEMSAGGIADAVVDRLNMGDDALIIVNFANPDMVGHTGDFAATVRAVEYVDTCLGRIVDAVKQRNGTLFMTADHGNAEQKIDPRDNSPLTAHTINPVPVYLFGTSAASLRVGGGLADIAPTVLQMMNVSTPVAMTGVSLTAE